ncbi:hypothetical protein SAMN04488541_102817 [Thermoflexibacter ruber]|uniref:Uncharacterized protein n=1 Tax=Thermoflexibacter ruber TaxID=1003 RepID=A0A1I2I190_9BACT|nr:hypothetical protein SAMN04488541_102817 [Thermoflexibacter ruber]
MLRKLKSMYFHYSVINLYYTNKSYTHETNYAYRSAGMLPI